MRIESIERDSDGKYPAYVLPGGYPMYYIDRQGNILCPDCASREVDASQDVVEGDVYWEGSPLQCDDCGKMIESAYGDPDTDE